MTRARSVVVTTVCKRTWLITVFCLQDIDETDSDRWCEYIMYRGLVRLGYARISHGGLSDTEAQIAKFRIPLAGEKYQDNVILTTSPKDVTEDIRFPNR